MPVSKSVGDDESFAQSRLPRGIFRHCCHEVFPLVCARCGGEMRIIAVITDAGAVREILSHLGKATSPPRLMKARAPPLRERQDANMGEDEAQAQPVPEYEFDQRIACQVPMRKGPDCSMTSCHRPSWEDSCLCSSARPVRPGG
jgi:hypothetical protein